MVRQVISMRLQNIAMRFKNAKEVRSVLRNSSYLFGNHLFSTIIRALGTVLLARFLQPAAFGAFNYGMAWYLTFIAFTYLGLDVVLGRAVGRRSWDIPSLVGATLLLRAGATLFVSAISAVAAILTESDPLTRQLLVIFTAAMAGRSIWLWCASVFVAFEYCRPIFYSDLIFRPIELAVSVSLLLSLGEKGILPLALTHAALWWVQAAVGVAVILLHVTPFNFKLRAREMALLLRQGLHGAVYTLTVIWFLQAPILMFRHTIDSGEALGHFALAFQLFGYVSTIPYLVGLTALPVLSRAVAGATGTKRFRTANMLAGVCFSGVLLSFLVTFLAQPIVVFIFGESYLPSAMMLAEAVWLVPLMGLAVGLQQLIFAKDKSLAAASFSGFAAILVMVAVFPYLTTTLSYHGVLLATGIGMSVWVAGLLIACTERWAKK